VAWVLRKMRMLTKRMMMKRTKNLRYLRSELKVRSVT
jgi:hypothetical protein